MSLINRGIASEKRQRKGYFCLSSRQNSSNASEILSNDLCSLKADIDRLAFSAVFELDSEAEIVGEWFVAQLFIQTQDLVINGARGT